MDGDERPATPPQLSRLATAGLLVVVVLAAGWLRLTGTDWDRGQHLHPDERFLVLVTDAVEVPPAGRYLDTGTSELNPANAGYSSVYGTAPLLLAESVAGWLHDGAVEGDQPASAVVHLADAVGADLLDADGDPTFDAGTRIDRIGRLLAALADLATVLAVFELGRVLRGRSTGVAAAAVYAACVSGVQHAHFFVVDPFLTLACTLALVAAVHVAKGRGRAVLAAGGIAAGAAGACKVSGLAVAAIPMAAALLRGLPPMPRSRAAIATALRDVRPLAADLGVVVAATLVAFRLLEPYAFDGVLSIDPRWWGALRDLGEVQAGLDFPPNVQWADRVPFLEPIGHVVRFGFGLPATFLALAGLGAVLGRGRWRRPSAEWLVIGWIVLLAALQLPRFVASMRYALPALPAASVLAGIGVVALWRRPGVGRAAGALAMAGCVLWAGAFVDGVYRRPHPRLAAAAWLAEEAPAGATMSTNLWDDALPLAVTDRTDIATVELDPFGVADPDTARQLVAALDDVDYVVESSDRVTGSVGRVPARYGTLLRYHAALEDGTLGFEPAATFATGPRLAGIDLDDGGSEETFRVYDHPTVRIWRKTDAFSVERALAVVAPERARTDLPVPLTVAGANGLLLDVDEDAPADGPTFDQVFGDRLPAPWLWWWLWWSLMGWAALPWTTRLLRRLPDRGWGLAKVLGPLAALVPLWFAVATSLVRVSATAVGAASAALVGVGTWVAARRGAAGARGLAAFARARWRPLLAVEALSLVAFGAVALLRAANPDLWSWPTGGEKPFAAAGFTAIARADAFPAADPWFSGGALHYHDGGWYLLAAPARLLGISPDIALNLGVATVASLLVAAAWSTGAALAAAVGGARRRGTWVGAGLAVVLAVVAGNLAAGRDAVDRLLGGPLGPYAWWELSRLNPPTADIDEFPAWSILFGDPHPHLLWAPIAVAAVGIAVAYLGERSAEAADRPPSAVATALAVALGAICGWSRVAHAWDVPVTIAIVLATTAGGALVGARPARDRARTSALHLALAAAVAALVAAPDVSRSQAFDAGFVASPATTPVGPWLLEYGAFAALTLLGSIVLVATPEAERDLATRRWLGPALASLGVVAVVSAVGGVALAATGVLVAAALGAAAHLGRRGESGEATAWVVVAAGWGLTGIGEVVVVRNDLDRMNTVFKYGFAGWLLLAVGVAAVVAAAWSRTRHPGRVAAVALLALAPTLTFWPVATGPRLDARLGDTALTLDGRAWLAEGPVPVETDDLPTIDPTADEAMIDWLRATAPGGTTIVEAVGPSYGWSGRVSAATGLPTILGWRGHELQQRWGYAAAVERRAADVDALYRSGDPEAALRVLSAYRPDLIVVGTLEEALGTPESLAVLADLPGVSLAWDEGPGRIYAV
ncbi:MAG: hypothetical protein KDA97_09275, partial [Acidimicrobiales bacterium]|nr:hypothetical protein [Acidimicrobiales bacterium]